MTKADKNATTSILASKQGFSFCIDESIICVISLAGQHKTQARYLVTHGKHLHITHGKMKDLEAVKQQLKASWETMDTQLQTSWQTIDTDSKDSVASVLAGSVAFGSTLALSTFTQWRFLGIATGTPFPTPTLVGIASVCAASWASHQAALFTHHSLEYSRVHGGFRGKALWQAWKEKERKSLASYQRKHREDSIDAKYFKIPWHTVRICTIGLLAYKVLGGRFWTISPSTYTNLGAFSRRSIPATERYANASQRLRIEQLGRTFGCHTCGSRARSFVGDHMPPKSVAEQMMRRRKFFGLGRWQVRFRFFPQCVDCSGKQGGILSKATQELKSNRKAMRRLHKMPGNSYFHGWRFRSVPHLAGVAVASAAVVRASPVDIEDENRNRYAGAHEELEKNIRDSWKKAKGLVTRCLQRP